MYCLTKVTVTLVGARKLVSDVICKPRNIIKVFISLCSWKLPCWPLQAHSEYPLGPRTASERWLPCIYDMFLGFSL